MSKFVNIVYISQKRVRRLSQISPFHLFQFVGVKMEDFQSNYERLPWYKKPKNWTLPSLGGGLILVLVFSTVVEEYHKEVEKHNDVIDAQLECKRNPPKSAHNRQSCWEANLKASRSPYVVALSNTGIRIFEGGVNAIQAIGKSYLFTAIVAIFSAMMALYLISAGPRAQGTPFFIPPNFGHFPNPYQMMFQPHQSSPHLNHSGKSFGVGGQQDMNSVPLSSSRDVQNVALLPNHDHFE